LPEVQTVLGPIDTAGLGRGDAYWLDDDVPHMR